ncbi:MAG: MaoC family dehydratase [Solirubrobacteraceae bacterium]
MDAAQQPTQEGIVTDLAGLHELVGTALGPTAWAEMTQQQVDAFADLTGDHNFIHVDVERARSTPFGGTIAHGFLTLSLLAPVSQLLSVADAAVSINYGLDRVRFPAPLAVGARFRTSAAIEQVTAIDGGAQVKLAASVEVDGTAKPACAAECLLRFYA